MAVVGDERWRDATMLFVGKGFRDTAIAFFPERAPARGGGMAACVTTDASAGVARRGRGRYPEWQFRGRKAAGMIGRNALEPLA